jgi:Zn-dependent alcohol dehydrogenase
MRHDVLITLQYTFLTVILWEKKIVGQSSLSEEAIVDAGSVVNYSGSMEILSFLPPIGCGYQTGAGIGLDVLRLSYDHTVTVVRLEEVGLSALMSASTLQISYQLLSRLTEHI